MLFTDSDCITVAQLVSLDYEISKVAEVTKLDVGSIIRQTWEECAHVVTQKMQSYGGGIGSSGLGSAHIAAVFNTGGGGGSVSSPRVRLSNVVVTSAEYANATSAILRWMQYSALALFYREVSNRAAGKDTDRYERKAERYKQEREFAWTRVESSGLPVCLQPLSAPAAVHEPLSGTWDASNIAVTGTATDVAQAYDVAVTWVASGYLTGNIHNCESDRSCLLPVQFGPGQTVVISIQSLNPPTGNYQVAGFADGTTSGAGAIGWNVYAGYSGQQLTRQNVNPLPLSTKTVQLSSVLSGGPYLAWGQNSFLNYSFIKTMARA